MAANLALRGSHGRTSSPGPLPPTASQLHSSPSGLGARQHGAKGEVAVRGVCLRERTKGFFPLSSLLYFARCAALAAVPHELPELRGLPQPEFPLLGLWIY